jgi:hypothetical protein
VARVGDRFADHIGEVSTVAKIGRIGVDRIAEIVGGQLLAARAKDASARCRRRGWLNIRGVCRCQVGKRTKMQVGL